MLHPGPRWPRLACSSPASACLPRSSFPRLGRRRSGSVLRPAGQRRGELVVATHWVGTSAANPSDGAGPEYTYQTLRVILTPHYAATGSASTSRTASARCRDLGTASVARRGPGPPSSAGPTSRCASADRPGHAGPGDRRRQRPGQPDVPQLQPRRSLYVSRTTRGSTEHVAGDRRRTSTAEQHQRDPRRQARRVHPDDDERPRRRARHPRPGRSAHSSGSANSVTNGIESLVTQADESTRSSHRPAAPSSLTQRLRPGVGALRSVNARLQQQQAARRDLAPRRTEQTSAGTRNRAPSTSPVSSAA